MIFLSLICFLIYALPDNEKQVYDNDSNGRKMTDGSVTFLALGDSYTIGESGAEAERWPVQLRNALIDSTNLDIESPMIIATTGWTTDELQKGIDAAGIERQTYDLVSLLIGVNNQYRGYPIEQYRKEFEELLKQAIVFAGGNASRVFVVSIPDYGATPFGQSKDPQKIEGEIDQYNSIAEAFADQYKVRYFNITPISREAAIKPGLVASDDLHPSGEMYSRWVEMIYPWVRDIFVR